MTKILHIHPDEKMANKFVLPLIEHEVLLGNISKLLVFNKHSNNSSILHCDLNLLNLALPIQSIKFLFILYKYKPEIVFFHNSLQSTLPMILSKVFKINKRIYFNHGITFLGYEGILKYLFFSIEKLNLLISDITITVSEDMKKILDKIKKNTILIHNGSACGLDLKKYKNKKNKEIKKEKIKVSYIGRLKKRKGSLILVDIVKYFNHRKDVEFIFCGFNQNEFFKFSKEKYKNVKFLGYVENIQKVYQETDILILPSYHEGMPYVILEAMSNGILIIANNIPGINSLIKKNYSGILIDKNASELYISEIKKISANKKLLYKYMSTCLKIVKKFDRVEFLKKYSELLNLIKKNK